MTDNELATITHDEIDLLVAIREGAERTQGFWNEARRTTLGTVMNKNLVRDVWAHLFLTAQGREALARAGYDGLTDTELCVLAILADQSVLCPSAPTWIDDAYETLRKDELIQTTHVLKFDRDGVSYASMLAYTLTAKGRDLYTRRKSSCTQAFAAYQRHLPTENAESLQALIAYHKHFDFTMTRKRVVGHR